MSNEFHGLCLSAIRDQIQRFVVGQTWRLAEQSLLTSPYFKKWYINLKAIWYVFYTSSKIKKHSFVFPSPLHTTFKQYTILISYPSNWTPEKKNRHCSLIDFHSWCIQHKLVKRSFRTNSWTCYWKLWPQTYQQLVS